MALNRLYTKKHVIVGLVSLLLIVIFLASSYAILSLLNSDSNNGKNRGTESSITINNQRFSVEIADSDQERETGLSFRDSLDPESGLLFIFENEDFHGIWMKDMNFSIDILWLDSDLEIIHIEENISPDTFPQTFVSPTKAKYVLEINAGEVKEFNLSLGQVATLN